MSIKKNRGANVKKLTHIEAKTLELISYSADRPTSCEYIANTLSITKRTTKKVINSLILKGVPILGGRGVEGRKSGYYIPRTEEERQDGLRSFTNQIKEMVKRQEALEAIDLTTWRNEVDER